MSQKVKSNYLFGLSHGSVRTFGSALAEPLAQSKVRTLFTRFNTAEIVNPVELNFG